MLIDTNIKWPNNAKIAIAPLFLLESWPEDLGVAGSLNRGSDRPIPPSAHFKKDLSVIRDRWFGETVGIYRLLDILNKHSVKSTFFINGRIADRNGELIKLIHENGHEIATESYDHSYSFMKTPVEEKNDIIKSVKAIEKSIGTTPKGYLSPGLKPTFDTPRHLTETDFHYWVDFDDDEVPYWLITESGRVLVIPNMRYLNDYSTFSEAARTPENLFKIWKETFDFLYEEGSPENGKLMLWDNHVFISGRPNRSIYLAKFLDYVNQHDDVWVAKADEIYQWWNKNYKDYRVKKWDESYLSPP